MIRYKEAIVEMGVNRSAVVLARTEGGRQRVIAEIKPVPTRMRPFRVLTVFSDGAERFSKNLGAAVVALAKRKRITSILIVEGTTDRLYQ